MKVELLDNRVGPRTDQQIGDVVDVEDREAGRMIAAGQARAIETATVRSAENAALRSGRKRR